MNSGSSFLSRPPLREGAPIVRGRGCSACGGTGVRGRVGEGLTSVEEVTSAVSVDI